MRDDDALRDLESLLVSVAPSATFSAGVRARVAIEDRLPGIAWWWAALAAGTVVAAAMGGALWSHRAVPVVPLAPPVVARTEGSQPLQATQAAAATPRPTKLAGSAVRIEVLVEGPTQRFMLGAREVVVPDDQRVALIRLLAGVRAGRATVPWTIVPAYDAEGLLVPLEPVVIAPLPELAAGTGDDKPGGGPGSRKD